MLDVRALVSIIMALLLLILVHGCKGTVEQIEVPDVTGLNEVEAVQALEAVGLTAAAAADWEADEPHGTVVEQNPGPGSRVEAGSTITLTVAREGS
jgi:eukaryotic-like serine/threonine-protein kinase